MIFNTGFSDFKPIFILLFHCVSHISGQINTDPKLCGGYFRTSTGYIDFQFNEITAPPDIAMSNKFCMWTISPNSPAQRYNYNMTIRNVNLNCDTDTITINYFNESSDSTNLGWPHPGDPRNPLCLDSHEVWERKNTNGTTMVIILHVKEIVYGKGFYLKWEEGYDSRMIPSHRIRNTYYSFGRPSVAPIGYFAGNCGSNEISTYGFIKANYTDGYTMDMTFDYITMCQGSGSTLRCFNNTLALYTIRDDGVLQLDQMYTQNVSYTPTKTSKNGFFFIIKVQDLVGAAARFQMVFETVRD